MWQGCIFESLRFNNYWVKFVNTQDLEAVKSAITEKTKVITLAFYLLDAKN